MIASFGDKDTERLALGMRVRRFVSFERVALRKIRQLQVFNIPGRLAHPAGQSTRIAQG